jgi:hypothetical protein
LLSKWLRWKWYTETPLSPTNISFVWNFVIFCDGAYKLVHWFQAKVILKIFALIGKYICLMVCYIIFPHYPWPLR